MIYVETTGTTCHIDGRRGTVKLFHYPSPASEADGAFVRLHTEPRMLYVELGGRSGSREQHATVTGWRDINRDQFDQLTGLADVRRSMGWDIEEEAAP